MERKECQRQDRKEIYTSIETALLKTEDLATEGWKINRSEPPILLGFNIEVNYFRYVDGETFVEDYKPTRAEIMARARAAKVAKAAAKGGK